MNQSESNFRRAVDESNPAVRSVDESNPSVTTALEVAMALATKSARTGTIQFTNARSTFNAHNEPLTAHNSKYAVSTIRKHLPPRIRLLYEGDKLKRSTDDAFGVEYGSTKQTATKGLGPLYLHRRV